MSKYIELTFGTVSCSKYINTQILVVFSTRLVMGGVKFLITPISLLFFLKAKVITFYNDHLFRKSTKENK